MTDHIDACDIRHNYIYWGTVHSINVKTLPLPWFDGLSSRLREEKMLFPASLAVAAAMLLVNPVVFNPSISQGSIEGTFQHTRDSNGTGCRCFPGDACWPTISEWTVFNQSIGGKLIATIPIASPCHDDAFGPFDLQECAKIQSVWFFPETHFETSSSVMAPYFTNNSCNPFLPRGASCTMGNYISYAVNASNLTDFQKTIAFVQKNNIRLTVRNTGHNYNGKTAGAGAVGIWSHSMKAMEVFDYNSSVYTGKAMKMGAGVQVVDAYQYAYNRVLVVIGGNCPTVGIAGGYTQGGGHSLISSKFGLAADQALEWEVVTATGEHLVATPSQNADLYWTLSGGGGGTYGVVFSLTVKAHPDLNTSAANLTFTSSGISQDSFWSVVETFQESLPWIFDTGTVAVFVLTNESFAIMPMQGPGVPKSPAAAIIECYTDQIGRRKNPVQYVGRESSAGSIDTDIISYQALILMNFRRTTTATNRTSRHGMSLGTRLVAE